MILVGFFVLPLLLIVPYMVWLDVRTTKRIGIRYVLALIAWLAVSVAVAYLMVNDVVLPS